MLIQFDIFEQQLKEKITTIHKTQTQQTGVTLLDAKKIPNNNGFTLLLTEQPKPEGIGGLLPTNEWQNEKMEVIKNPTSTEAQKQFATQEICIAFENYIQQIAISKWNKAKQINGESGLQDIISEGKTGLITAIRKWKPIHNKPLSFLASQWITNSCRNEAKNQKENGIHIPNRIQKLCIEYKKNDEASINNPRIRHSTKQLVKIYSQNFNINGYGHTASSLQEKINHRSNSNDPETQTLQDVIQTPDTTTENCNTNDTLTAILKLIDEKCNPRQKFIFLMKSQKFDIPISKNDFKNLTDQNGKPINIDQILKIRSEETHKLEFLANCLKITKERVRQIYNNTRQMLAKEFVRKGILPEYTKI